MYNYQRCSYNVLWLLLLSFVFEASASGADVTVKTVPDGALITLKGEATVSGVSPVRFRQPLLGDYTLVASMPGYEARSQRVVIPPDRQVEFSLTLRAKTRLKATLRSLVFPGWGQLYAERPRKAFTLASLSLASVAAYLIVDHRFDNKYQDYLDVRQRYDGAATTTDRRRLWADLQSAQRTAYDAEDNRRIAIGVVAGIWAINVLDAFLFAPHRSAGMSIKAGLPGTSSLAPDPGLRLGINF
ncbi:MAG: DUF5683 domain-containing protein [bacterium]